MPPLKALPSRGAHTSVIHRPSGVLEARRRESYRVWRVSRMFSAFRKTRMGQKRRSTRNPRMRWLREAVRYGSSSSSWRPVK